VDCEEEVDGLGERWIVRRKNMVRKGMASRLIKRRTAKVGSVR